MMKLHFFYIIVGIMVLTNCKAKHASQSQLSIDDHIEKGDFTVAARYIDSLLQDVSLAAETQAHLRFARDSLQRVMIDFNQSENDIVAWINRNQGFAPTQEQMRSWEADQSLEHKTIDGEKKYFRNAAANLFRVNKEARALSKVAFPKSDLPQDSLLINALNNMMPDSRPHHYLLPPVTMKVRYKLSVKPDVAPNGEILRAWLPYAREDLNRQKGVRLMSATPGNYRIASDNAKHRSVYMEQAAKLGEPAVFEIEYEFTSQGEWFDFSSIVFEEYDKNTELYQTYTSERWPHIVFTDYLKQVADSVTLQADGDYKQMVRQLYHYVSENYPWASALEYSTIPNITEYALQHKKGDCGQVALLMISMLRYKGIPARWQSGWMMHPGSVNLHDWLEYYVEGTGWIPMDISFSRGSELAHEIGRDFFMSGIDSYRLYVNNDFSGAMDPIKRYPRSETVDFQRGEVETNNDNLYFNMWNYNMEVGYK